MGDSTGFHEPVERLSEATLEHRRALRTLMEELEAIDWYQQRIDATQDPELRAILAHNRDEEKEHAAMTLEWLRRHDPAFEGELRDYLFTDGPIAGREAALKGGDEGGDEDGEASARRDGSLGIGSLKVR